MADGFLGRWSQRKQALREGRAVDEPPEPKAASPSSSSAGVAATQKVTATATATAMDGTPAFKSGLPADARALQQDSGIAVDAPKKTVPAPTLEDVKALNADSSFAPFVSRDVAPDVRNAAMKKLFTDPHYNVMDGLDIYIDDYSKADPMPATMLRQMASAKFLNLFDEDPAPASATPTPTPIENTNHDHTDLRLQPDDAAGPARLERESERSPDTALEPVPPRSG